MSSTKSTQWHSPAFTVGQVVSRLEKLFAAPIDRETETVYSFDRLKSLLVIQSSGVLTLALRKLTSQGKIRMIVRVESPSKKGGIGDFSSIDDVPDEILDWRTGRNVEIGKENLKVLFAPAISSRQ